MTATQVNVRYMVDEVLKTRDWYVDLLGFTPVGPQVPAFAAVERGPLRLLLSGPASSAGRAMPDGERPVAGGWNRFQMVVEDIGAEIERLGAAGVTFRNALVTGPGGSQILIRDPAGNLVELFQPAPVAG